MLSRAKYLKTLERDLNASRKIIDDLTQENYELREVLKTIKMKDERTLQDPNLDSWADEKIKDLLFSCVFNVKLRQSGLCKKLLCEMNEAEYRDYALLVESFHR
jgi:hypothetical protein